MSGIWMYTEDTHFSMVLEEDPATGKIVGFMLKNNERRWNIEGIRRCNNQSFIGYRLYELSKLYADGRCARYTVRMRANGVDLDITKMGTDMTKPMKLSTKIIPQQFQDELVWYIDCIPVPFSFPHSNHAVNACADRL